MQVEPAHNVTVDRTRRAGFRASIAVRSLQSPEISRAREVELSARTCVQCVPLVLQILTKHAIFGLPFLVHK